MTTASARAQFAMVAGEPSGDLLAGLLLDGCARAGRHAGRRHRRPAACSRAASRAWWPQEKLAVRGYVEVLRHYAEIAGIRRQLQARLLREWPDIFIGVDAPDFNLDLEARPARPRHEDGAFRLPVDLGLARRSASRSCALRPTMCCASFPFEPAAAATARHRRDLRGPSAGQRDSDAADRARRARRAGPGRRRAGGGHAAGQPALGGALPGAALFRRLPR